MSGVADAMFACIGCGRSYLWKQELAGRKVKCKCGQVMECPTAPPEATEEEGDGLYAFADEDLAALGKGTVVDDGGFRCPSCQEPMQAGTVLCTHCGFNLKTKKSVIATASLATAGGGAAVAAVSPVIGYAGAAPAPVKHSDDVGVNMWIEYWIPIGLILVGAFLSYIQLTSFDRVIYDSRGALQMLAYRLVVDTAMLIVGCLLAVQFLEVSLGSPGPALLKLVGIAIAPGALASMIGFMIKDPTNMVAFVVDLGLIMILLHYLFDFEARDVRIVAVMVAVIRIWLGWGLIMFLLHGGFAHIPTLPQAQLNADREASDAISYGWAKDAKNWLDGSTNRIFGHSIHQWSLDLVNKLHNAGCQTVDVRTSGPYGTVLYATLPSDSVKRKTCFNAATEYYKELKVTYPIPDKGQNYLVMPL